MHQLDDAEIAKRLLHHLARAFGCPDAVYLAGQIALGGLDAAIFGFTLDRAPPSLAGPLILRLGRATIDPARMKLESVVQNTLAEMGYPAPRVMVTECDPSVLGGPFTVMTRLPGQTLATVSRVLAPAPPLSGSYRSCSTFWPSWPGQSTNGSICRSAYIGCQPNHCCGP